MAIVSWEADAELLTEAIDRALSAINQACDAELGDIRAKYPESEVLSWTKQEDEARHWAADSTTDTPLVDALAAERGVDKAELVSRIIAKADAYTLAVGTMVGKRQRLEDQILALQEAVEADALDALDALAQIEAVRW